MEENVNEGEEVNDDTEPEELVVDESTSTEEPEIDEEQLSAPQPEQPTESEEPAEGEIEITAHVENVLLAEEGTRLENFTYEIDNIDEQNNSIYIYGTPVENEFVIPEEGLWHFDDIKEPVGYEVPVTIHYGTDAIEPYFFDKAVAMVEPGTQDFRETYKRTYDNYEQVEDDCVVMYHMNKDGVFDYGKITFRYTFVGENEEDRLMAPSRIPCYKVYKDAVTGEIVRQEEHGTFRLGGAGNNREWYKWDESGIPEGYEVVEESGRIEFDHDEFDNPIVAYLVADVTKVASTDKEPSVDEESTESEEPAEGEIEITVTYIQTDRYGKELGRFTKTKYGKHLYEVDWEYIFNHLGNDIWDYDDAFADRDLKLVKDRYSYGDDNVTFYMEYWYKPILNNVYFINKTTGEEVRSIQTWIEGNDDIVAHIENELLLEEGTGLENFTYEIDNINEQNNSIYIYGTPIEEEFVIPEEGLWYTDLYDIKEPVGYEVPVTIHYGTDDIEPYFFDKAVAMVEPGTQDFRETYKRTYDNYEQVEDYGVMYHMNKDGVFDYGKITFRYTFVGENEEDRLIAPAYIPCYKVYKDAVAGEIVRQEEYGTFRLGGGGDISQWYKGDESGIPEGYEVVEESGRVEFDHDEFDNPIVAYLVADVTKVASTEEEPSVDEESTEASEEGEAIVAGHNHTSEIETAVSVDDNGNVSFSDDNVEVIIRDKSLSFSNAGSPFVLMTASVPVLTAEKEVLIKVNENVEGFHLHIDFENGESKCFTLDGETELRFDIKSKPVNVNVYYNLKDEEAEVGEPEIPTEETDTNKRGDDKEEELKTPIESEEVKEVATPDESEPHENKENVEEKEIIVTGLGTSAIGLAIGAALVSIGWKVNNKRGK